MTSGLKLIATALLGLSVLAASRGDTAAKPLSSEACVKLVNEHTELAKGGIEEAMNQDPENAGAALNEEQLARIERFLFIEGQIRFRCPEVQLPGLGVPEPSKTQAAKLEKKKIKKPKGPAVPMPERKPKLPSKSPG
ncbi:hypothetical protein BMS3Bbin10_01269 [bacterium BMS3Bbin10]|nr:hypothetical protein BMS3Bbin10_01269 [bacterium BMS3Bbin10]